MCVHRSCRSRASIIILRPCMAPYILICPVYEIRGNNRKLLTADFCFYTACKRSCWKVMFSLVSVCPQGVDEHALFNFLPGGGEYAWSHVPSREGVDMCRVVGMYRGVACPGGGYIRGWVCMGPWSYTHLRHGTCKVYHPEGTPSGTDI